MKYAIKFADETLPIEEDEVKKVVQAMQTKSIVVLKCGVINGFHIRGIIRDLHGERGFYRGYQIQGSDQITNEDMKTNLPEVLSETKLLD